MPRSNACWNLSPVVVLISIACLTILGCGKGDGQPRGTVSGTVTHQGAPVSDAIISFINSETSVGADATLGSDGTYEIVGIEGGLPAGTYKVSVTPPEVEDPNSPPDSPPMMMLKEMPNVPEQYRSGSTSPLTATIAEGDNVHDFDLTDE